MPDTEDGCDTVCPHCGARRGDAWENNGSERPNVTKCGECGKLFWQWAEYDINYCTSKLHPRTEEEPTNES